MDLFTFLLCKKKGGGGGGLTYTLSADTVNKQIVLTPSEGDAQAITVPYATDASTVNGKDVPELENGKIPATYLPSYVDDVLEYENLAHFPAEGETGKIYIALDTSLIYRWSGSTYAEISQSLALGETEATAYRGDRGKIAYDHSQSAHAPSDAEVNQNAFSNIAVGSTTIEADSKTDTFTLEAGSNITLTPDASTDKITIAATDTTYSDATTSTSGLMSGADKTKLNGIATGAEVNQNAFSNIKIGSDTIAADSKTDILELEAGTNIELTSDTANDKVTISGIPVTKTIRDASVASFSDGGSAPIQSLTASIVPVQDLHGYDSPWAGGAGKNKLPNIATSQTKNGITLTVNSDGSVNVNGTATANTTFVISNITDMNLIVGTRYILNGCPSSSGNFSLTFSDDITTTYSDYGNGVEFTLSNEFVTNNAKVRIFIKANETMSNVFKPMIRLATVSDTTFAPYSNICPISGWSGCNIGNLGSKNWYDTRQSLLAGYLNRDGTAGGTGQSINKHTKKKPIKGGITYTYSVAVSRNADQVCLWYDKNNNVIDGFVLLKNTTSITAQAPINAVSTSLTVYNVDGQTIQLEAGSQATAYEPYNPNSTTTTIPFTDSQGNPVEVYGGSVDVVNGGEQQRTLGGLLLTDLTWSYKTINGVQRICSNVIDNIKTPPTDFDLPNIMASCYVTSKIGDLGVSDARIGVGPIQYSYGRMLVINDSRITSLDDIPTVLSGQKVVYELATPTTFYTQPTSIKSLDGENNVFASTGPLREVTYRTQAYGDFIATRDLPDAISDIKTLKLDENQILIGDGNFDKIGLFMDDYYDENLDTTFTTEVTPQEIYLTSQPAESVNQTTIISGDRTEYQTSLLSGTEVINTVNAIGMEVNVKENGSITHGIKIVSGDIRLLGSDTWDGTNISLKNALEAIQNNLYIANYNKTASLSNGSNTIALDMTGYTYNGSDIINVYVDGLYKVNNTDYTITVNDSTGVASINYTAAAAGTMAIQVIKPKIGFTALTDNSGNNVTDSNGNSIDI